MGRSGDSAQIFSRWSVKVGDLVKMKRGYSVPGLVVSIKQRTTGGALLKIMWPDCANSTERERDVCKIDQGRV